MKLEIVTPEKIVYTGDVKSITLPGVRGSFSILEHHAPLITILSSGKLSYTTETETVEFEVLGGFVEVNNNKVNVSIEEIVN